MAFMAERALPAGVTGPCDFAPLVRAMAARSGADVSVVSDIEFPFSGGTQVRTPVLRLQGRGKSSELGRRFRLSALES